MRILVALYPCQHLKLSVFLVFIFLVSEYWYFIMVWICVSIMSSDVKYLFKNLMVIFFCGKVCSNLLHIKKFIGVIELSYYWITCSVYTLDTNLCCIYVLQVSFPNISLTFCFLNLVFQRAQFWIWKFIQSFLFSFIVCTVCILSKKFLSHPTS